MLPKRPIVEEKSSMIGLFFFHGGLMPKGTKVDKIYQGIKKKEQAKGNPDAKGKAARIAQAQTDKSLATGKKPKGK